MTLEDLFVDPQRRAEKGKSEGGEITKRKVSSVRKQEAGNYLSSSTGQWPQQKFGTVNEIRFQAPEAKLGYRKQPSVRDPTNIFLPIFDACVTVADELVVQATLVSAATAHVSVGAVVSIPKEVGRTVALGPGPPVVLRPVSNKRGHIAFVLGRKRDRKERRT
jgi:hypothetical protein